MLVDRFGSNAAVDAVSEAARVGHRPIVDWVEPPRPWSTVVTVLSVIAALGGAVVTALLRQYDLRVYVMGAHHVLDGRLYTVTLPVKPYLPFTYPPFAAIFFWPLAPLPFPVAKMIWSLINVTALTCFIAVALRAIRPELTKATIWRAALFLSGFVFWLEPIRLNFHFGQINIVLGLMVLADLTMPITVRGRTLPRGVLVGVAGAIKLIPLIYVLYLFCTRQLRAAVTATVTFVTVTLAAALVAPKESWSFWTHYATDAKRVGTVFYLSNQSLRGTLDRLAHRELSASLTTAIAAVVFVAGLSLAVAAYRRGSAVLSILVTATTGILVSPISWSHHLVWIVPILLWLVLADDRPAYGRPIALVAAAIFWWGPIWIPNPTNYPLLHEKARALLESNSYCFMLVGFLVWMTVVVLRRPRVL